MGFHCCVPLCYSNTSKDNISRSFHRFPKDPQLMKQWIHNIKRDTRKHRKNPDPFTVNAYTKVCSLHFQRSDFIIRSKCNRLKPDAVPTVFSWIVQKDTCCRNKAKEPIVSTAGAAESEPTCGSKLTFAVQDNEVAEAVCDSYTTCVLSSVDAQMDTSPTTESELTIEDYRKIYCETLIENRKLQLLQLNCHNNETEERSSNLHTVTNNKNKIQNGNLYIEKNFFSANQFFSVKTLKLNPQKFSYYTGFADYLIFKIVFNLLVSDVGGKGMKMKYTMNIRSQKLCLKDQFLLVLTKLRQGFGYEHLSTLFNISVGTVGNICVSWINFIYIRLGGLNMWPHRDILLANAPSSLNNNIIGSMDATELFIQTPTSLIKQSQTYSTYKSHNTLKGFIVVDNSGGIIFISSLFTGCMSDNKLVEECGFIDVIKHKLAVGDLCPGDTFLADKGFTVHDLLKPVEINIPVFKGATKFTATEVNHTRTIAHERIHVERAIGRVKSYKILSHEVPISLLGTFNQIWTVCCLLSNFKMPLCAENVEGDM